MTKRRDVIRILEENGFVSKGGTKHEVFAKPGFRTSVPRHKEIPDRLVEKIKKQAGL